MLYRREKPENQVFWGLIPCWLVNSSDALTDYSVYNSSVVESLFGLPDSSQCQLTCHNIPEDEV
jgi:hypothetical protein